MAKEFQDKVVLITGGASGIGHVTAQVLVRGRHTDMTVTDAQQLSNYPPSAPN